MTEKQSRKKGSIRRPTVALVTKALNEAAREAVEVHRKANLPLVVWEDGQVKLISPDSIPMTPPQKKPRKNKKKS